MAKTKPNPGSAEATKLGCTCPRMDNGYGRGARGSSGSDAIFFKREGCPLHWLVIESAKGGEDNG